MENGNGHIQNRSIHNNSSKSVAVMRTPTALLRDTWRIYTANIFTFIGILVIPALISLFVPVIVGGLWVAEFLSGSVAVVLAVVVGIAGAVIGLWGQLALLFAITDEQHVLSITDAYKRAWPYLLSYFWIVILVSAITLGGFVLFVIPGIIISVWFSFAWYVFATEQVKGMDALMRSKEYVRGYWWSVVGRFIVLALALLLVASVVQLIASAFDSLGTELIESTSGAVLNVILTPFILAFMFLVYKDLKQVKGGGVLPTSSTTPFTILGVIGAVIVPLAIGGMMYAAWFMFSSTTHEYSTASEWEYVM